MKTSEFWIQVLQLYIPFYSTELQLCEGQVGAFWMARSCRNFHRVNALWAWLIVMFQCSWALLCLGNPSWRKSLRSLSLIDSNSLRASPIHGRSVGISAEQEVPMRRIDMMQEILMSSLLQEVVLLASQSSASCSKFWSMMLATLSGSAISTYLRRPRACTNSLSVGLFPVNVSNNRIP